MAHAFPGQQFGRTLEAVASERSRASVFGRKTPSPTARSPLPGGGAPLAFPGNGREAMLNLLEPKQAKTWSDAPPIIYPKSAFAARTGPGIICLGRYVFAHSPRATHVAISVPGRWLGARADERRASTSRGAYAASRGGSMPSSFNTPALNQRGRGPASRIAAGARARFIQEGRLRTMVANELASRHPIRQCTR